MHVLQKTEKKAADIVSRTPSHQIIFTACFVHLQRHQKKRCCDGYIHNIICIQALHKQTKNGFVYLHLNLKRESDIQLLNVE